MPAISPYHRYNLRRNPFGELTREERAHLAVVDVGNWLKFLADDRSVLQFIGPCGHGKTTHLLAMERAITNAEYVYLPEHGPNPTVGDHRPMIVDEAQRLSYWQLRRVLKRGGPLIFGTHTDHSQAIARARLNGCIVDVSKDSSIQQLTNILNQRVDASRHCDGAVPKITARHAIWLQSQFGANVRAIEHFLYEQLQHCISERKPWPPAN